MFKIVTYFSILTIMWRLTLSYIDEMNIIYICDVWVGFAIWHAAIPLGAHNVMCKCSHREYLVAQEALQCKH